MGYYYDDGGWAPYVPTAKRRELAIKKIKELQKKGKKLNPICITGRIIATTFWGKAWCDNLENYSDYSNRLPRGRTYLRNGSVIDLQVTPGKVEAQVMGSSLYRILIKVKPMPESKWQKLVKICAGKIDSLIELLQGRFSKAIMSILIAKDTELFPSPDEISMHCSCPDHAGMCKHIAAVLYGIGAAIDTQPEWLFSLRHIDYLQLIDSAARSPLLTAAAPKDQTIEESDLASIFGVEMESLVAQSAVPPSVSKKPTFSKFVKTKVLRKKRSIKHEKGLRT